MKIQCQDQEYYIRVCSFIHVLITRKKVPIVAQNHIEKVFLSAYHLFILSAKATNEVQRIIFLFNNSQKL